VLVLAAAVLNRLLIVGSLISEMFELPAGAMAVPSAMSYRNP